MGNSQSELSLEANKNSSSSEAAESNHCQSVRPPTATPTPDVQLPKHVKCEPVLKEADSPPPHDNNPSADNSLNDGVFLNQMKEKFWVEKGSNKKCFMLFARGLSITWADTPHYWHWKALKESPRDEAVDVAELVNVCWLEVHGKHAISRLSPETYYEVLFVVMLKDPAYGWEVPVNLRLVLPDGTKQERRENLMEMPRGKWIEIPAGEFRSTTMCGNPSEVEFSMYEYEGGKWKRGLVVKGVVIRPKKEPKYTNNPSTCIKHSGATV